MRIFSCSHIHKTYPVGFLKYKSKEALTDITFQVNHQEVFGIIGLNGAGKSSILKLFMGFTKPNSGTLSISGNPTGSINCHRQIGYLPEHPSLYPHLSITEHLRFGCQIAGLTRKEEKNEYKLHWKLLAL